MTLSDAVENLYTRAPGAPDAVLSSAYRDAVRRFLRKAPAWKQESTTFTVGATTAEYVPTVPADAELFDIRAPRLLERDLLRLSTDQIKAKRWPATGTALAARLAGTDKVILAPDPGIDVSAQLSMTLVLRPTRDALTVPDDLVDEFSDIFEAGALAMVYSVPGQPWSSMNSSSFYAELFNDLTAAAEARVSTDNMMGVTRVVRYGGAGT